MWASGLSILCVQGTFDSYVLKVSLRSFGAFPIFHSFVSRNRVVVEEKGRKFGHRGQLFVVCRALFTVKSLRSV